MATQDAIERALIELGLGRDLAENGGQLAAMALRLEVAAVSCRLGLRHTRSDGGREGTPRTRCGGLLDARTALRLNDINRAFYRDAAASFRDARRSPWPGWDRLIEVLRREIAPGSLSVLDVGCGHGRFAAHLDERLAESGERFAYLGVDVSEPLLEAARARTYVCCQPELRHADPISAGPESLPDGPFTLTVLFGFLHHVPGDALRRRLLRALADRLAAGGLLAFTSWDFQNHARFRKRVLAWSEYNRLASVPIDVAQLEPGDLLLPWGDGQEPVRYCHFSDAAEIEDLLASLPLERVESWLADGREGRLNRYFVLRARG